MSEFETIFNFQSLYSIDKIRQLDTLNITSLNDETVLLNLSVTAPRSLRCIKHDIFKIKHPHISNLMNRFHLFHSKSGPFAWTTKRLTFDLTLNNELRQLPSVDAHHHKKENDTYIYQFIIHNSDSQEAREKVCSVLSIIRPFFYNEPTASKELESICRVMGEPKDKYLKDGCINKPNGPSYSP